VVSQNGTVPRLHLSGGAQARARELGIDHLHLTLTHEGSFAAAVVIAERLEVNPPND
jgi:holo-[acyl-carrier protein] synthase